MKIQHNIGAMNANRQLNIVSNTKSKSTEKLSSGYRINRAADDAAGLSISEKMRKQIRGLQRGVANVEDGVSLCQVADGALAEVTEMLQRINELSVQAANGTNSTSDRESIQEEIDQIKMEVDRISNTTKFNEIYLFKGNKESSTEGKSINEFMIGDSANHIDPIYADKLMHYQLVKDMQRTITITGSANNMAGGHYTILANQNEITINGQSISWNDVTDSSNVALDKDLIGTNTYSFDYQGLNISFDTKNGMNFSDVITGINESTFDVTVNTSSSQKVTLSNYGVNAGSDTDTFLSMNGTRWNYPGGYNISADDQGIQVTGFSKVLWNTIGINDLDNAGGQVINFSDPESGVHFQAQIDSTASKDDIINSINNSKFYWGYIDMSTTENARLGYRASSVTTTITNPSNAPVKPSQVTMTNIYEKLYENLGYTTKTDKLQNLNLSISISGSTQSDLKITFHAPNGNSYSMPYLSWDPAIYHYANPSGRATIKFGDRQSAVVAISMSYSTVNVPADADAYAYLGTLGTIATDVKVPSQYYFRYSIPGIRNTTYSYTNINTKEPEVPRENVQNNGTNDNDSTNDDIRETLLNYHKTEPLQLWIQAGAESHDGMYIYIDEMNPKALGINSIDVTSETGADKAMNIISFALKHVSINRSRIGAQQNRLEHTIRNEENIVENLTSSESKIRDTDMADEMLLFSNLNILEQTGQSMLAQANQNRQEVLKLLQ